MKKVMYLHGFASAGSTGTAVHLRDALYARTGGSVLSPDIPVMPKEALKYLRALVQEERPDVIVGTSMGGMYAECLKGVKRICVNPSFCMAKMVTFHSLGKNVPFKNARQDGATSFKADRAMVSEFREIERTESLQGITAHERGLVWGLFGKDDKVVNCQAAFVKAYGRGQFRLMDGDHNLTQGVIKRSVLPLLLELLELS